MTDDDMASLVETGEYLLSVTCVTKKTPVVTVGSSRDPDQSDSSDKVDESSTSSETSTDPDDSHVGVLPPRVRPTVPPTARRGSSGTTTVARSSPGTTASAACSSRGASAGQDNSVVATAAGRRGTSGRAESGRSSRAPPGGSADGAEDPFIQQVVSMVDAAPDKEREQLSVALAALQMQADAAARRDYVAATNAVKKAEALARRDAATAAAAACQHEKEVLRMQVELEKERYAVMVAQLQMRGQLFKETKDPAVLDVMKSVGEASMAASHRAARGSAVESGAASGVGGMASGRGGGAESAGGGAECAGGGVSVGGDAASACGDAAYGYGATASGGAGSGGA